ncbi:MAG: DUF3089 domain-containing protein [Flavobacteriales bacterium]|nr:DUF3089 domain-containing protein [Flavobacteriales bacterium]
MYSGRFLRTILILCFAAFAFGGCHRNWHYIPYTFRAEEVPQRPDYGNTSHWAALPDLTDLADATPKPELRDQQDAASCDVFFVHPTTFYKTDARWNAPLNEAPVNEWTDKGPMLHQASVFNGTCRVYAPRYRQAHFKSYLHPEEGGRQALDTAYSDVKQAFIYYLQHYNQGRPFYLAAHSQGSSHAIRLIQDLIDQNPELRAQMIAAIIPGMPVHHDDFENVPPCTAEEDLGCFMTWMTYGKGFYPDFYDSTYVDHIIHNPITGRMLDTLYSPTNLHLGIVNSKFKLKYNHTISASCREGMLWIERPDVPVLKWFIKNRIWHTADYNLFWMNLRNMIEHKANVYLGSQKK